ESRPWLDHPRYEPAPIIAASEAVPEQANDDPQTPDAAVDEPFDRPDTQKLGIIGGKGSGKTYLFQAMVYRTLAGAQAGALTHYLENDSTHLYRASGDLAFDIADTGTARPRNRASYIRDYKSWQRLGFTQKSRQEWLRLRLPYRTGYLGGSRSALDVDFLDASGEVLGTQTDDVESRALWEKAYLHAAVMVFCLPLWAAFPAADLSDDDWETRDTILLAFEQVVQNYREMRVRANSKMPVSTILALTMADDRRTSLRTLHDRWIAPFMESPHTYLRQLRSGNGIARYLANARKVSEMMHEEFAAARNPQVATIPQALDHGRGKPWIVALSAIDGTRLDDLERRFPKPDDPDRLKEARKFAPVPVHVELPLLVALCERENALM
ncbi:MAG: hypothetical protein JOZ54_25295, partial [Acidobacteria bacterium]|nr:hypothetical protein [Acidobacteriota bacterium]